MEKIYSGKSLDAAKEEAISDFAAMGIEESAIDFEILEQPVKKLFGMKGEYKIKAVSEEVKPAAEGVGDISASIEKVLNETSPKAIKNEISDEKIKKAVAYLNDVLEKLGAESFEINVIKNEESVVLDIVGEKLGVVIGRRGETLDSLQYLAILASNRVDDHFSRMSVDCNGYREKRKEALEVLAERTCQKVLKTGRRVTLEPMNPYERRIIHSKVSEREGVSSHSLGEEPYRKVVISSNTPSKGGYYKGGNNRDNRGHSDNRERNNNRSGGTPYKHSNNYSTSFEREYKRTKAETVEYSEETFNTEKNSTLFEKIDI